MGLTPAVDLKSMPVKVAAPIELNSSSSPPRNFPINVSRLQYMSAVHNKERKFNSFQLFFNHDFSWIILYKIIFLRKLKSVFPTPALG